MKPYMMKRIVFLVAICSYGLLADFTLAGRQFKTARNARHDNYVIDVKAEKPDFAVALGVTKDGQCAVLQHKGKTLKISKLGVKGDLAVADVRDLKFPCAFTIRNGDHSIEVLSGGRSLLRTMTDGIGKGDIAVSGDVTVTSYQRLEHFVFGDDFMRTEEEAKEWGLWTPVRGKWLIHSVMERIQANPAARIREGYIPVPDRSPNPFCIAGATEEGKDTEALILTGQPFWCNYVAAVSVRPSVNSEFGLAFAVTDADNLWLLKWSLPSLGMKESHLKLIRRNGGKEKVVTSIELMGRAENWCRLGVTIRDGHITAYLDKVKVLEADSDFCTGGKIGLFCNGKVECRFDDVDVKSLTDYELSQLPDSACKTVSGKWKREKWGLYPQKNGSRMLLGFTDWEKASIVTQMQGHREPFALLFAYKDEQNYCCASWTPDKQSVSKIERIVNGRRETLAELEASLNPPCKAALFYTDDGHVEFRLDDVLVLRAKGADTVGCCGIEGTKKLEFHGVRLFAENSRDWELPVDVERFRNDPFMQGWASTRYSWIRQGEAESYPQTHLFTGDVYGALAIDAPLMPGLSFEFGADDFGKTQSTAFDGWYRVACELDEASGNGKIVLFRKRKMVASSAVTGRKKEILPGTQIIDEKIGARPRTADTPSFGKLSILRDGLVIAVSLDDKELFTYYDPEPRKGRALQTAIPNDVDFIHFAVRREKLLDYLFEKAETDWGTIGRWEVTNRFACDPRWSHMNGESRGLAALWSKFDLMGDYTIECFAGMRMRQGELLEGAGMSYPRVGDINLALNCGRTDLFSGGNVLIAAWDSKWSEMWTKFLDRDKCVFKTDTELIPRGRKSSPGSRPIKQVWDPGGRPVHGAWYALKIRHSRGGWYSVWFDNYFVGSFMDHDVNSAGHRIALWTQYNSIVIARMKVGYERLERFAPLPPTPLVTNPALLPKPESKRTVDTEWTPIPPEQAAQAVQFSADAETGFKGLSTWNGDQSAELSIVRRRGGKECLLAENVNPGGDFGVAFPFNDYNLRKTGTLSFDCMIPEGSLVNLYVWLKEHPNRKFFVHLTGSKESSPLCTMIGDANVTPGKWSSVAIDLSSALGTALPYAETLTCVSMALGMQHEGYLNAGLGGNIQGAQYLLDKIALKPLNDAQLRKPKTIPADGEDWPLSPIIVDFGLSPAEIPMLKYCQLACGNNVLGLNSINSDYDAEKHVLTIKPLFSALPKDSAGKPVKITFGWKNAVDLKNHEISWNLIPRPEQDKTPPPPPLIDPSRSALTYENSTPLCYVSGTDMLSISKRPNGMLEATVTARVAAAQNTLTMGFHQIRAPHFPYLLFDYAFDKDALVDLRLQIAGRRERNNLGLTDNDNSRNILRKSMDGIIADGKYHTARVDIMDFLLSKATSDEKSDITWGTKDLNILDIAFGNLGYRGTAPGTSYKISNVRLAPTLQWSNGSTRISWASPDLGGIKGYSVIIDDNDNTMPPKEISHTVTFQDFTDLKDGLHFVHVRACDNNDNWGEPVHAPFYVNNSLLYISSCNIQEGAKAAPDKLVFKFNETGGQPDLSAMKLIINENQQNILQSSCTWNQDDKSFSFNLLTSSLFRSPIKDGTEFKAELSGIKNSSGIVLPNYKIAWSVDCSLDKNPPAAPLISGFSLPYFECFERPRNQGTLNVEEKLVFDEIIKSKCLEFSYASGMPKTKYVGVRTDVGNLKDAHILRFKYCIKQGSSLAMLYRQDRKFMSIKLTPNTPGTHVAEAKGILDDGKWHTAELDLAELVKDTNDATFSPIYFGVNEGASATTKVRLDDVSFVKDIKYACAATMTMGDETGIKAFESKISDNDDDEPDEREDYRSRHLLPLTTTGRKFLHVRARDGAGNASPTLHIPFNVVAVLPQNQEDGLEKRNNASVIDEDGHGSSIVFDKCYSGENTLAFVQFYRNGTQRTMILYPCRNKFIPGEISFDLIPLKFNGINVQMVTIGNIEGNNKDLRPAIRNNRIHGKRLSAAVKIDKTEEIRRITVKLDKPLEKPPLYVGLLFEPSKYSRDAFFLDNIAVK